ncbi:hypothetical protein SAMN06264364_12448 [Quadrisphaera granulorum]|uniref:Basic secretory peptidase family protein n=1 Tax=Quadrisphaera granulorum TaxID=317664 RepID=A0A315ZXB2_9ACTN|nr:hypothetical protein [Quadrisphaera granulorum]PWJ49882.1 hypothetical protein BXY45_12448 [Quadrisphaera granulorum]SZE98090.1 hypothetical protein SAMN06264364_12448 [Quadrisphaera granulorum]
MAGRHSAAGPPSTPEFPRRRDLRQHHRRPAPRSPRLVTRVLTLLLSVAALAVLATGASRLLEPADPAAPVAAPAPSSAATATDPGDSTAGAPSAVRAVQALLDARAAALLARDGAGWRAAVAGDDSVNGPGVAALAAYRERTRVTFDRLEPVPLGTWHWEVTGSGPALSAERAQQLPAGSWVARTTLVWSVAGAGDDPVRRQQDLTVVPRDGGWAVADDADGETVPDLWDLGAVRVVTSERAVVIGTAERSELDKVARLATTSARSVDAVWGTAWPRATVVEVPADQQQMARLLGRDDDAGLEQIAAVTTGELVGGRGATRGDHVVVNPRGFGQLAALGQEVVLTHELTHVATRSGATRAVPLWLSEGFADWVGYRGTRLSRQDVAADLLTQVRAGRPPRALPTSDDFDPTKTSDVGPAYSSAWLAVEALAQRYGDDRVVALYRTASREGAATDDPDAALDASLASVLGTDRAGVDALWRAEIAQLAAPR